MWMKTNRFWFNHRLYLLCVYVCMSVCELSLFRKNPITGHAKDGRNLQTHKNSHPDVYKIKISSFYYFQSKCQGEAMNSHKEKNCLPSNLILSEKYFLLCVCFEALFLRSLIVIWAHTQQCARDKYVRADDRPQNSPSAVIVQYASYLSLSPAWSSGYYYARW